jgi:integrase
MAHLYKRKDKDGKEMPTWYLFIEREGHPPLRQSTKTSNKQLANELLEIEKKRVWRQDKLGIMPDRLFTDFADEFLEAQAKAKGLKASTVETYESLLNWWKPALKGLNLRQITQTVIVEKIKLKEESGASNATCNRHLAFLRSLLNVARKKYKLIDDVPTFFLYREPKARVRWLKPHEVVRLLDALPAHVRDMAEFSLATGLRQGNVLTMTWGEVDLVSKRLTIEGIKMKNGDPLALPINDTAMQVLTRQVGKHAEAVFTYRGKPITSISNETWKRALEKADIKDFRWHDLRHTWASMLIQAGVPAKALQVLGAWETPSMVDKYAHQDTDSLRPYAGVLDRVLGTESPAPANAQITTHSPSKGGLSLVVNNVKLADGVGFEPTEVVETSALFKSAALNHSATHPEERIIAQA